MKAWIGLLCCLGLLACATPSTRPPLTDDERLQRKYAGYSTELLLTQRMDLATFIAHGNRSQQNRFARIDAPATTDPQQQLDEIEAELSRRHAAGDGRAELHPVAF